MKKVTQRQFEKIKKELDRKYELARHMERESFFKKTTKLWTNYNNKLKTYEVIK